MPMIAHVENPELDAALLEVVASPDSIGASVSTDAGFNTPESEALDAWLASAEDEGDVVLELALGAAVLGLGVFVLAVEQVT